MNFNSDTQQKLSVFLSHSHKDIEKVRKLRDILEFLDCEPLMFYLKCLDEDKDELNDFIRREINARNLFIYCKSKSAEQSAWVQKELAYIRSLDSKRLYTVDIDQSMTCGMLGLLEKITGIIRRNQVFISYAHSDGAVIAQDLYRNLQKKGYNVFLDVNAIPSGANFSEYIINKLNETVENGVFIPIITPRYADSKWCGKELLNVAESDGRVLPLIVGNTELTPVVRYAISRIQCLKIGEKISEDTISDIDRALRSLGN